MRRLRIACEEQLEVDKLLQAEQEAKKTGEFDILYQKIDSDNKAKENEEEANIDDDSSVEVDAENNTDDSNTDHTDDQEIDSEEQEVASESMLLRTRSNLSLEDMEGFGSFVSIAKDKIFDASKYLFELGVKYTPTIASHVYKGISFLINKTAMLLITGIAITSKYIVRRQLSFSNLKEDIAKAKETLNAIETPKTEIESNYRTTKVINTLKISDNIDVNTSIASLATFLNDIVKGLDESINNEIKAIKQIIALSSMSSYSKSPSRFMVTNIKSVNIKEGSVPGYELEDEMLTNYIYNKVLPGDIVCIMYLPKEGLEGREDLTHAYNKSKLFLGLNANSFKEVEFINYMTKEDLSRLLDNLSALCDKCIEHQSFYESINKAKLSLKYNFKNYFNSILQSKEKVSIGDSMVDFVYLKTMFIDKVYLAGAIDIHDYTARVISNTLSYVKSNLKELA